MLLTYHRESVARLDPLTLYGILRLRLDVFVVEQAAAYPDLDGRDVEDGAELHWAADGPEVVATLRVLRDPDGALRVGRVATAARVRSHGVASGLMRRALERCVELDARAPVVLDAQAHLADWYARFGFVVDGAGFEEDGIPHVPMRRAPLTGLSATPARPRPGVGPTGVDPGSAPETLDAPEGGQLVGEHVCALSPEHRVEE